MHFTSSSAPALIQTVLEGTSTVVTSSANPSAVGQSVTFTATVTISGGRRRHSGRHCQLHGRHTILSTQTINAGGVATYATSTLTAGVHQITAVYNGDASKQIQGSTSAVLSQEVQAPTTATLTSSLNPSIFGNSITFTATVPPGGSSAPTGTVNFLDGATTIGTGTLAGNPGVATFTTSALSVGTHPITAAYAGDSKNGASTSLPVSQVVNQTSTATTVTAAPSPGIAGGPETITATIKLTVRVRNADRHSHIHFWKHATGQRAPQQCRHRYDHSGARAGQLSNCRHIQRRCERSGQRIGAFRAHRGAGNLSHRAQHHA